MEDMRSPGEWEMDEHPRAVMPAEVLEALSAFHGIPMEVKR